MTHAYRIIVSMLSPPFSVSLNKRHMPLMVTQKMLQLIF